MTLSLNCIVCKHPVGTQASLVFNGHVISDQFVAEEPEGVICSECMDELQTAATTRTTTRTITPKEFPIVFEFQE